MKPVKDVADMSSGPCVRGESGALVKDDAGLLDVTRRRFLVNTGLSGVILSTVPLTGFSSQPADEKLDDVLRAAFFSPPDSAKAWVYWWWLDGAASFAGITADLEAMRQQGIGGVLLFDAGTGGPGSPKGPLFMSAEWRENFRHAVSEAAQLGIEMGVNLCSGWNAGGPWVPREQAVKSFVWKETVVEGSARIDQELPRYVVPPPPPPGPEIIKSAWPRITEQPVDWYRDIAVLACRETEDGVWRRDDIQNLSNAMENGRLQWNAPRGRWTILRMGYVIGKRDFATGRVSNPSWPVPAWEIDPLSADAMDLHFRETAAKLIEDAGPLAGKTFKYTHIDSWEIGRPTWTARFVEEFVGRRGYDPVEYLPVLAGKTLDNGNITNRFNWDYRRTIADLVAENYYGRLSKLSHQHGLGTHSESGGPVFWHYIDALETLGTNDIPMGEFWSSRTRFPGMPFGWDEPFGVSSSFFEPSRKVLPDLVYSSVRQAASAAHVYGKPLNQAEALTNTNKDWSEDPAYLKPFVDRAFCLGLTRNVFHGYVHQSTLSDRPGYVWEHIGPHLDRNITWWPKSHAWFSYLARCQFLLTREKPHADILYFSGQAIPNFVLMDAKPIAGFDFDVINAHALLTRAAARDGRVTLPDGLSYRYFVLPDGVAAEISPDVLEKIRGLVEGGVTLVGERPERSLGLKNHRQSNRQVEKLANSLWGEGNKTSGERRVGKGRVIWGRRLEAVIAADRLQPDVEFRVGHEDLELDWIHRQGEDTDIYFLANGSEVETELEAVFRIAGKVPELWDPVTGNVRELAEFRQEDGRTSVPLSFAAGQSWFVVFRRPATGKPVPHARNFPDLHSVGTLTGAWEVDFDKEWDGPENVIFPQLEDWSERPEEAIRYFSGQAVYRKVFDLPQDGSTPEYLDLGAVENVAQVRLNGKDLGVLWTAPWRVSIADAVRPTGNRLEIEVINLWPNRLIGDARLPKDQRRTKTNVRTYETKLPEGFFCWWDAECEERKKTGEPAGLLPSGLLGPVRLLAKR